MLESSKVPALTRAIDILNLIARIGPCSAATIIDTLGIPKSTAYLLLNELRRQRFLSLDDAPRDKCTLSCAINGIHAAFHYLKKNYISGCVMTVPTG